MSDSLSSLYKNLRLWVNCSCRSLLVIQTKRSQKQTIYPKKNSYFSYVFGGLSLLFPFLGSRANRSRCSSLHHSFLKSDGNDFLSSLFTKELQWAIRSFSQANRSFAHKKRAIRSKKPNSEVPTLTNVLKVTYCTDIGISIIYF